MQTFGFPNADFAFSVAVMHASWGTKCKVFKEGGTWYVSI